MQAGMEGSWAASYAAYSDSIHRLHSRLPASASSALPVDYLVLAVSAIAAVIVILVFRFAYTQVPGFRAALLFVPIVQATLHDSLMLLLTCNSSWYLSNFSYLVLSKTHMSLIYTYKQKGVPFDR
jgi:hypothetical protein